MVMTLLPGWSLFERKHSIFSKSNGLPSSGTPGSVALLQTQEPLKILV